jgi:hypothetical protein
MSVLLTSNSNTATVCCVNSFVWSEIMMVSRNTFYGRLASTPRRIRRLTVIAAFAGYPLVLIGYSTLVEPGRLPTHIWAPIAIVLMGLTIVGCFATYGFTGDRMRGRANLDERERA